MKNIRSISEKRSSVFTAIVIDLVSILLQNHILNKQFIIHLYFQSSPQNEYLEVSSAIPYIREKLTHVAER
jgi:hypothetical protein